MKTIALLATGIDMVELAETFVPDPGPGQIIVETIYSAISPGTEMRCLAGRQPRGAFPFIPGYSTVGRVLAKGAGAIHTEGSFVFCQGTESADYPLLWGGHIAHALCNGEKAFSLPNGVTPLEAVLTKLAAIAYRGVQCAITRPNDEVAVVGLGAIGQLAARLHKLAGGRVVAADISPDRVAIANAAGIESIVPGEGLVAAFAKVQPNGADIVVDSTGFPSVLQQSIQLCKLGIPAALTTAPTRLVVQGSYVENVVFDYHEAFGRELSVYFPRDSQPQDIRTILGFLADGRLNVVDLVSEEFRPSEAKRVYSEFRAPKCRLLTAVFRWK